MGQYWFKQSEGSPAEGPFTGAEIKRRAALGELTQHSLVSTDNSKWTRASEVRGLFPAHGAVHNADGVAERHEESAATTNTSDWFFLLKRFVEPLYKARGWIICYEILLLLSVPVLVLSVWGIFVVWVPVWCAQVLSSGAQHLRRGYETNNADDLRIALKKLGTFFTIMGILAVVSLFVVILGAVSYFFLVRPTR